MSVNIFFLEMRTIVGEDLLSTATYCMDRGMVQSPMCPGKEQLSRYCEESQKQVVQQAAHNIIVLS